MLKNKHILLGVVLALILSSCSTFHKTLNKGTAADQYALATEMYNVEKYNKSIQLFEKAIPFYRGKPQMERLQYMLADANFKSKNYLMSAYYFDKFTKNYPRSTKREDAAYLSAQSYYLSISKSSLDQTDTKTAIEAFQKFIDKYPDSSRIKEANGYIKTMQQILEQKDYDIAYSYYHTERYKSAVFAFENFLSNNLGTQFKEDALYYKSKSAYLLAINSINEKKEERINSALKSIARFEHNYADNSKYASEITEYKNELKQELTNYTKN